MSCLRCGGFLLGQYDIVRCLNCGYHLNVPVCPPIDDTPNENRRWTPDRCEYCGKPAVRGKAACIECRATERGENHAAKIRRGMAEQKESAYDLDDYTLPD